MKERQRVVDALAALRESSTSAAEVAIPGARVQLVEVGEDAALGPPGGARRVEEAGRSLGCRLGAAGGPAGARQACAGTRSSIVNGGRWPLCAQRLVDAPGVGCRSASTRSASEWSIW